MAAHFNRNGLRPWSCPLIFMPFIASFQEKHVTVTHGFQHAPSFFNMPSPSVSFRINAVVKSKVRNKLSLDAAPEGSLSDIVIPSIFNLSDWKDANDEDEDPRVWVPQTDCLSFRPLCFCTSQGYYVNLLKFKGGGILGRHRHSSPVHAVTFKGSWGYREHGWHAYPGTYVFEPPGETHTLIVDQDCDEMVALFHVTGSLLYVSEETDEVTGFDDVFSKLEKARDWYDECGLGRAYADQFIR